MLSRLRAPFALAATMLAVIVMGPAAAAQAGTVTLDHPCYIENGAMVATGTGFTPNAPITLSGDGAFATATADASGSFQVPIQVPTNPSLDANPSSIVTYTLNVEDGSDPAQNTSATYQVTNFAVDRGASSTPRKTRTWRFAGFAIGQPIYAHFRYKGRTQGVFRMGVAKGPCGTLTKRAPGIVARTLKTGTWTIQIDQAKSYKATTRPAVIIKVLLYLTSR